jgi:hypothetical protein
MLGILFVVSSAKGHSVSFSYPFPPQSKVWGFNQDLMASLFSPKSSLCDQPLILTIDGKNFIGRAATFQSPLYFTNMCQPENKLSMFNVVLVTRKIKPFYLELLAQVADVLVYEQIGRNFIKNQVDIIANVRENNTMDLNKKILQVSSLARALANIYHQLNTNSNSQQKLDALSPDSIFDPCILLKNVHPPNILEEVKTTIRPYQTLLLLDNKEDILDSLPIGASPLIIELIKKANPLKWYSFVLILVLKTMNSY